MIKNGLYTVPVLSRDHGRIVNDPDNWIEIDGDECDMPEYYGDLKNAPVKDWQLFLMQIGVKSVECKWRIG